MVVMAFQVVVEVCRLHQVLEQALAVTVEAV
jgi:hypothetical protein